MRLLPLTSLRNKISYVGFSWFLLIALLLFASCTPSKKIGYFQTLTKDTVLQGFVTNDFESKIQKKDVLSITTSSYSNEMDEVFNGAANVTNDNITSANTKPGYTVDDNGNILIHYLGSIHVEGMTRKELKEKLQKDLLPYMKDPIVSIHYLNHKVTVLGNVTSPQILNIPGEQMSLLDVIVSSGDIKENSARSDVMIIREKGTEKIVKHINLEDHSIFSSPWYYVQPNDIVYVMPDKTRTDKDERRRTLQTTLSLVASGISLLIIIFNNLIK